MGSRTLLEFHRCKLVVNLGFLGLIVISREQPDFNSTSAEAFYSFLQSSADTNSSLCQ